MSVDEVELLASSLNLTSAKITPLTEDELGRDVVQWQTVVLRKE